MPDHDNATARGLDKIDDLDLAQILARVAKDHRWNDKRSAKAELWYKRFLKLCYLHRREPIAAINRDADELWHYHILDTDRYQRNSRALFGHYLNHEPIYGRPTPEQREAYERALEMYRDEFGESLVAAARVCWGIPFPPVPPRPKADGPR